MRWLLRLLGRQGPVRQAPADFHRVARSELEQALEDLEAADSLFQEARGATAVDKAIYRFNLAQAEVDEALYRRAGRRELPLPWLVGGSPQAAVEAPQVPRSSPPADVPETGPDAGEPRRLGTT